MFRSFSTKEEAFEEYVNHHAAVQKQLFAMGEGTLLIDCHSFSSMPTLLNATPSDINICIGYNDDETCPNKVTIGNIIQHFKSKGYKVGVNEPFSNSKTFSVPLQYHSVMLEVNKITWLMFNYSSEAILVYLNSTDDSQSQGENNHGGGIVPVGR